MSEVEAAGFVVDARRTSGLFGAIGPLYTRRDDTGVVAGLRVDDRHLNSRGFLHGGVAAALLDVALGDNVAARTAVAGVTATLTIQYVARAVPGDWIEASASIVDVGRQLAHATGELRTGERVVAIGTASFALKTNTRRGER